MKKKWIKSLISSVLIGVFTFSMVGCGSKTSSSKTQTVKLNEVVRSIFYAPMYVSINKGFFKEEGLKIELSTGQGADKTMQQVLSKTSDIGLCGPEQAIYIYNQGREDYPVVFGQLTQTDGSFLFGKKEEKDFNWKNLKGKKVIGGRPGGMPEMAFEYALKKHGLTPKKDVDIITNIAFNATAGAFKSGNEDYVTLFEPTASLMQKQGGGHIVASIGKSLGSIPYTCFFSTKSYIRKNPELVQHFLNAISKGQQWLYSHSDEEIVDTIKSFFPGNDIDTLIGSVKNYKKLNSYAKQLTLKEEDLNKLMDIIESYNKDLIKKRPPFNKIVDNSFAEKVTQNNKK